MPSVLITSVVFGVAVGASPAPAFEGESPDAYEIAIRVAVPILPSPLQEFFTEHLDQVQQDATAGLRDVSEAEPLPGTPDSHYIALDVGVENADAAVRQAAVHQFPRIRSAAKKHFNRHGQRVGGQLPWTIGDRYDALVEAFRGGDGGAVLRESGALLHFAIDAASPFNTTVNRDGAMTDHVRWSAAAATRVSRSYCTVRHRFQVGLVRRLRTRLEYEARVLPDRFAPVTTPVDAAFDTLIDAHGNLDALLTIDREVMSELGIVDETTFTSNLEAYEQRAAERASSILETQIEAAALLGANLIGGAWIEAGKPPLETLTTASTGVGKHPAQEEAAPDYFVGSRNSTVFHRPTCSHAKRIKDENLVRFDSAKEAIAAGRTPCRSCRPSAP